MKNYYDYGCGKGEHRRNENAFEAKNRYGYEDEWDEKDCHEEHKDCHCAKVYTLRKHECECEKEKEREDMCECKRHGREDENDRDHYNREDKKHSHECEKHCREDRDDRDHYNREDKKHSHECEKHCREDRDDQCEKEYDRDFECFCIKVCVPPFPFRCRK